MEGVVNYSSYQELGLQDAPSSKNRRIIRLRWAVLHFMDPFLNHEHNKIPHWRLSRGSISPMILGLTYRCNFFNSQVNKSDLMKSRSKTPAALISPIEYTIQFPSGWTCGILSDPCYSWPKPSRREKTHDTRLVPRANVFQRTDLLLSHGRHDCHHQVLPFSKTILDLWAPWK